MKGNTAPWPPQDHAFTGDVPNLSHLLETVRVPRQAQLLPEPPTDAAAAAWASSRQCWP